MQILDSEPKAGHILIDIHGIVDRDTALLDKPFTPHSLLTKVHEVLHIGQSGEVAASWLGDVTSARFGRKSAEQYGKQRSSLSTRFSIIEALKCCP